MTKLTINIGQTANDKAGDPLRTAFDKINQNFTELYSTILADVQLPTQTGQTGKILSTNGSTLSWIPVTTQIQSDWDAVSGLGVVLNKPTIPAAQVNSDWNAVGTVAEILNKPTLFDGTWGSLTAKPTVVTTRAVPVNSYGVSGDLAGHVAFSATHIYYCHTNYVDNLTDIWVRQPWVVESW